MANDRIEIDLFEDVLMGAVREIRRTFRVSLPGKVVSSARDIARVSVQLGTRFLGTDRIPRDEPTVPDLPVIRPRGGGYGFHFDMRAGDPVVVSAQDMPVRGFFETGDTITPQFPYGHQFGTAVAFAGGWVSSSVPGNETKPPNAPGTSWIGAEDGSATIKMAAKGIPSPGELGTMVLAVAGPSASLLAGSDQSADPAACANEVLANLQALNTMVQAWVPIPNDGGASLKPIIAAWFAALQPMADLKVMLDGPVPLPP